MVGVQERQARRSLVVVSLVVVSLRMVMGMLRGMLRGVLGHVDLDVNVGRPPRAGHRAHHGSRQPAPQREQHCQQNHEPEAKRLHRN